MAGEAKMKALPEHLVTKIISMVRFPFIFKAWLLSKSWQARFSQLSSINDEELKCLAAFFQQQGGEWSGNWKTFCSAYWHGKEGIAFDRTSQKWKRMPSLSFMPNEVLKEAAMKRVGALVLLYPTRKTEGNKMYVANLLTRSWKLLPVRPLLPDQRPLVTQVACGTSIEVYDVILLYAPRDGDWVAQIYDSKSNTWSCKSFHRTIEYRNGYLTGVYLDRILYLRAMTTNGQVKLLALNVGEETVQELKMPSIEMKVNDEVICKGTVWIMSRTGTHNFFAISKVVSAGGILKVNDGPPLSMNVPYGTSRPVSDGRKILWVGPDKITEYDVVGDAWSKVPWKGTRGLLWYDSTFHPGLNPFVAV